MLYHLSCAESTKGEVKVAFRRSVMSWTEDIIAKTVALTREANPMVAKMAIDTRKRKSACQKIMRFRERAGIRAPMTPPLI